MALNSKRNTVIKKTCTYCNKPAEEVSSHRAGNTIIIKYKCGHSVSYSSLSVKSNDEMTLEERLTNTESIRAGLNGKKLKPYPFQVRTALDVIETANGRALINHEMGLGKTVIDLIILKECYEEMTPCLIICKSSLKYQIFYEIERWLGKISNIIVTSKDKPLAGVFPFTIVSYETLALCNWTADEVKDFKSILIDECQQIKNPTAKRTKAVREVCSGVITKKREFVKTLSRIEVVTYGNEQLKKYNLTDRFDLVFTNLRSGRVGQTECKVRGEGIIHGKIVIDLKHAEHDPISDVRDTILHEIAHAITPGAGHIQLWKDTAISIGCSGERYYNCEGTIEETETFTEPKYIIATSGTPIKNTAVEYFPILNILHPERFPNHERYIKTFVDTWFHGNTVKYGGIKDWEYFRERTKDFIFRYTRDEVMPDLPKIDRQLSYYNLSQEVQEAYNKELKGMIKELGDGDISSVSGAAWTNILAYMNKMRQLVGYALIDPTVEMVLDFLSEHVSDDRKITIGVHHQNVANILRMKIETVCKELGFNPPLQFTSALSPIQRNEVIESFRDVKENRVLIGSTLSMGEGLNIQFCSDMILMERQWNPANEEQFEGRFSRIGSEASSITARYPTALGTINEFFAELVEKKRGNMKQSLDGVGIPDHDNPILKDLAKELITRGMSKFKLTK